MGSSNTTNGYDVYTGLWTNWSKQAPMRQTLTVTKENGDLLIAFLAFYVALIGTRFWRLSCLALHRLYSTNVRTDGLYHQRQALLRNGPNAESGILTLVQLAWIWKRLANRVWARILPVLSFSLLCFAFWSVAAGFSSRLFSLRDNQVLLTGKNCAVFWGGMDTNALDTWTVMYPATSRNIQQAAAYAQTCYENTGSSTLGCDTFIRKKLQYSIDTNASCPFADEICYLDQSIRLDSGLLDSNDDFGLNTEPDSRWQYRQTIQCSPIKTQGYTSLWNYSDDRSYTRFMYGPLINVSDSNFTLQYAKDAALDSFKILEFFEPQSDYYIGLARAELVKGSVLESSDATFEPISPLVNRSINYDLGLVFLVPGNILFASRSQDPWYQATEVIGHVRDNLLDGSWDAYTFPEPASLLGCIEQFQYCVPGPSGNTSCTEPAGYYDTTAQLSALLGLGTYNAMIDGPVSGLWSSWGSQQLGWTGLDVLATLGSSSLLSRGSITDGVQGPLPANQWQLEIQHWFATSLTTLQASTVAIANGPDPAFEGWLVHPNTTEELNSCQSQKILSTEFSSFSFFWLLFILILGLVIIVISFAVEPCLGCAGRKWNWQHYQQLEWTTNEVFQLQRLAHEELGLGTWSRTDEFIPVTFMGEKLGVLDLGDKKHPRLIAVTEKESENTAVTPQEPVETGDDRRSPMTQRYSNGSTENTRIEDEVGSGDDINLGLQLPEHFDATSPIDEEYEHCDRAYNGASQATANAGQAHGTADLTTRHG